MGRHWDLKHKKHKKTNIYILLRQPRCTVAIPLIMDVPMGLNWPPMQSRPSQPRSPRQGCIVLQYARNQVSRLHPREGMAARTSEESQHCVTANLSPVRAQCARSFVEMSAGRCWADKKGSCGPQQGHTTYKWELWLSFLTTKAFSETLSEKKGQRKKLILPVQISIFELQEVTNACMGNLLQSLYVVQQPYPAGAWSKACLGGSGDPAKPLSTCLKPVLGSLFPKAFPSP